MTATVDVSLAPEVLDWVLRISPADHHDDPQRRIVQQWKSGERQPNIRDINEVSRKLHIPFSYFFLTQPIDDTPAIFEHRTIGNGPLKTPSRDLVDTVADMSRIQDWARQDQIDNGGEPLPFIGSMTVKSGVVRIADSIRKTLGIEKTWYTQLGTRKAEEAFTLLRERAAQTQIIVMMNGVVGNNTHRKLNPEEFRAFALVDEYAPLIFINRADEPETARLFSLVHEFAHLWLGQDELFNDGTPPRATSGLEQACNAVAAEILMPTKEFTAEWHRVTHSGVPVEQRIEKMHEIFPASWTSIALRALNSGSISQTEYERITDAAQRWATRQTATSSPGGNYYNTKLSRFDNRLLDHLVASVAEGRTSYVEAYRLTGTNRRTFPELLKRAGL
ncbi:ImmA/IrrE family metallo-endopeptidase [Bifidobacterium sp. CP2]|uniref:ImmA/IrrE family metallo-endopeptidase n=1 Tax=Bifidobacterium sp. CP2 TaxID=2809025 RepID=UPI001BDC6FE8|nr:ImmA/IrrE family metallo-endopeptidase [Bifidobacterium sp. CP2]MBT1182012.1 ImmA/IrrE family metallo-endopeptidase [Bifidobacterium sp. CP2]